MRRARTSAKEGNLFCLLWVQSSFGFSSIVDGARGVRRDGEGDDDRPRTVSGRRESNDCTSTTSSANSGHPQLAHRDRQRLDRILEGCRL